MVGRALLCQERMPRLAARIEDCRWLTVAAARLTHAIRAYALPAHGRVMVWCSMDGACVSPPVHTAACSSKACYSYIRFTTVILALACQRRFLVALFIMYIGKPIGIWL